MPNRPFAKDNDNRLLWKIAKSANDVALLQASESVGLFSRDAFGRWRTSAPETLFDSKQIVDYSSDYWDDTQVSGGGTSSTYSQNRASTTLAVSNLTSGRRVRQTKSHFNYQPGKSQLCKFTFVLGTSAAGITRRVGYFNDLNGIFLEQTVDGLFFVIRSYVTGSASDTRIPQSEWNLDKLNGSGDSLITLDPSKSQIFFIDFEWLAVGSVRFGFVIDGVPHVAHRQAHANSLASVYMSNPNLPVRYEIINSGTGAAASLEAICCTVISEGGTKSSGTPYCAHRGTTALATLNNTAIYPLVAIRYRSDALQHRISMHLTSLNVVAVSAAGYRWVLLKNPTVVGTALSFSDVSPSIQAAVGTTNATTLTGGRELMTGYLLQRNEGGVTNVNLPREERLGVTYAGTSDVYVLAVQVVTGAIETFYGSLNWDEFA